MKMVDGNSEKGPSELIDYVRESVEKCMWLHMNKRDTIKFLATHKNIQPAITRKFWENLEGENPEFFRAYYVRLAVKDQIIKFNRLLSVQKEHMPRRGLAVDTNEFYSSESHSTQQVSTSYAIQGSRHLKQENMAQLYEFNNNGALMRSPIQGTFDQSVYVPRTMLLSENPNVGLVQTAVNDPVIRSEAGYNGGLTLNFGGHNSFLESNPPMGDDSMSLFTRNIELLEPVTCGSFNPFLDGIEMFEPSENIDLFERGSSDWRNPSFGTD